MIALLVTAPLAVWAQTGTVEFAVSVRDALGLPIAGAAATLTDEERGSQRSAETGTDGLATFLGVQPGLYRLQVESAEFRVHERGGLRLRAGERVDLAVVLDVGPRTETIRVSADAPLLRTGRGGASAVVDDKLASELPLNGRNFTSLLATLPGVAMARGTTLARVSGSRPRQNDYLYDGLSVLQPEPGQVAYFPIVDAIEELHVDLNGYSAEYGRTNGGVIRVRHKSGGNEFHGSLFEFFRHEALNARNVFAAGGEKPPFRRNQFGFVAGGPLRRDRTFFFGEYQGSRLRVGRTPISVVPSPAQLAGDFSGGAGVYDPASTRPSAAGAARDRFPNDRLPASRIDRAAAAAAARYPAPNREGPNNFIRRGSESTDQEQFGGRLDHVFSDRQRLFARLAHWRDRTLPVAPLPDGSGRMRTDALGDSRTRADSISGEHAWTPGPRTLNQLRAGLSRRRFSSEQLRLGRSPAETVGLPGLPSNAFGDTLPVFLADGFERIGPTSGANARFDTSVAHIVETLALVRGGHSWKIGGDLRIQTLDMLRPGEPAGNFRFTAPFTGLPGVAASGHSVASMLLGQTESFRIDLQDDFLRPRAKNYELFVQDDWRAHSRLTLNLGLRYTYNAPSTEKHDRAAVFDLDSERLRFLGRDGEPRSARDREWGGYGPRFGLAWRPAERLVARAGFGLSWFERAGITTPFITPFFPFIQSPSLVSLDNLSPAFVLADGPRVAAAPIAPNAGLGQGVFGADRRQGSGYSQQWNFTLQRTFRRSYSFEAGYVGNKITRLGGFDGNLNQLSAEQLALGEALLDRVPNPYLGEIPAASSLGGPTITRAQLLRQWPRFTTVSLYRNNIAQSIYHGLQTTFERRAADGLTFRLAYTYSKLIDDASAVFSASALTAPFIEFPLADSRNRQLERDVSLGDIPQIFAASFVWSPRWRGAPNGFAARLFDGWSLGGIARLQAGIPLAVEQRPNLNSFAGFGSQRPNRLRNPNLPAAERTTARFFDTSAFAPAARFALGDSSRNPVRGPGWRTLDLSVARRFPLNERVAAELRAQTFNATNTPAWDPPNGLLGTPGFGAVTGAGDPRVYEFVVKLHF